MIILQNPLSLSRQHRTLGSPCKFWYILLKHEAEIIEFQQLKKKQKLAKRGQPKSVALVNLHRSEVVNDTGFSTLLPQGFFELILVALCS